MKNKRSLWIVLLTASSLLALTSAGHIASYRLAADSDSSSALFPSANSPNAFSSPTAW
jgi:hypothetical protein